MKISLTSKEGDFSFLWGFTDDSDCVDADMPLPRAVEKAIQLSSELLGSIELPMAHLGGGGHGNDSGLIFLNNAYENLSIQRGNDYKNRTTTWEVATRISAGPTYNSSMRELIKDRGNHWDGSEETTGRFHFTVRASRLVNPLIKEERDRQVILSYDQEAINFSMRWVDGKFDDWNDFKLWKKDKDSDMLDHYRFSDTRTSYFRTEVDRGCSWENADGGRRLLVTMGERKPLLPSQPTFADISKKFKGIPQEKVGSIWGFHGARYIPQVVPAVGYAPILQFLSDYGDVSARDARQLPKMTPQQGAEYVFGKVLPAMLNYARIR